MMAERSQELVAYESPESKLWSCCVDALRTKSEMHRLLVGYILRSLPVFFGGVVKLNWTQKDYLDLFDNWAKKMAAAKICESDAGALRMLYNFYNLQKKDKGGAGRCVKYFNALRYCHENKIHSVEGLDGYFEVGSKGPRRILVTFFLNAPSRRLRSENAVQKLITNGNQEKDDTSASGAAKGANANLLIMDAHGEGGDHTNNNQIEERYDICDCDRDDGEEEDDDEDEEEGVDDDDGDDDGDDKLKLALPAKVASRQHQGSRRGKNRKKSTNTNKINRAVENANDDDGDYECSHPPQHAQIENGAIGEAKKRKVDEDTPLKEWMDMSREEVLKKLIIPAGLYMRHVMNMVCRRGVDGKLALGDDVMPNKDFEVLLSSLVGLDREEHANQPAVSSHILDIYNTQDDKFVSGMLNQHNGF
jgi:hypothetical protein